MSQNAYEPAMVSIIPQNYPHVTISDTDSGPSFWEYLFFDPMVMIQELYPDNPVIQKKILQMVNQESIIFFMSGKIRGFRCWSK
ncbi:MAG: hypothetical protein ACLT08_08480 [Roseburia inulinivorans]